LYEYIIADDDKKKNKPNKKAKINNSANRKKKKENLTSLGGNTGQILNTVSNYVYLSNSEVDKEIEDFKNQIKYESIHANDIRKVKPKLSVEWIQYVTKM
jgi:hypothetical protein